MSPTDFRVTVRGSGSAVPVNVVTNDDLSSKVDTSDEWIVQRTGIRERRVSSATETTSSLATEAAQQALETAGLTPDSIDLIVVATVSGDFPWPSTACLVQEAIGAKNSAAYDISAACSGFIYALANADAMVRAGLAKTALVIGADCLTKQLDWTDRGTCILFGDGAGAVVLQRSDEPERGVLGTVLMADGAGSGHIIVESGGSRYPTGSEYSTGKSPFIQMNGREVYRFAVNAMGDACEKVLAKVGLTADDVDLFVPHQANIRIIQSAAERLGLAEEKVFVNLHKYGNTSGASIPLALHEATVQGRLKPGMIVLTVGFGSGLTWGANLIRW